MKFVALVSGGKDSCFNILHCLNAGHELVAMANLHPRKGRPDEIDSYMFQTVGHQAVEKLSVCADVPLFRAEISENEEEVIEELASLFTSIKRKVEFDGVSVGAIGSQYQQIRVDRACQIVGLRSLAYLWQRPQTDLLHEIVNSGLDVRIIKVAGMGLDERHLGKRLGEIEQELLDLHQQIGLHPCGEGGEYETMVFDGPFFKQRLQIKNEKVIQHSTDDVYYLDFEVDIVDKAGVSSAADGAANGEVVGTVHIPPLLDEEFAELNPVNDIRFGGESQGKNVMKHISHTISGSYTTAFNSLASLFSSTGIQACYHVVVAIKNMADFASMNQQYIDVFTNAKNRTLNYIDPSRACVEFKDLPCDIQISVYYTNQLDMASKGIHVQGLSYWAPASIGPYSQCRMVFGISYMAGQIGLVPQTLELAPSDVQPVLALQSAVRVLDLMHELRHNWTLRLAVVYITNKADHPLVLQLFKRLFPKMPLLCVVVSQLPRNARCEWSLQACDTRYFAWFVPENDEDDELYSPKPEITDSDNTGYHHRAGFQVLRVSCGPLEEHQLAFTTNHKVGAPARSVFYNNTEVDEIYISY